MANRPRGFGLTSELQSKISKKYSTELEQQARVWLEGVLGRPLVEDVDSSEPLGQERFRQALKDGVILCKVINILQPGSVQKIHIIPSGPFKPMRDMENIANFLKAAERYGVQRTDLCQSANLVDRNNDMAAVLTCIHALGRAAQSNGYSGPTLGPKQATHNPRNFDDETMQAGKTVIGLQYGFTKGASQRGMNFGKTRSITD